MKEPVDEELKLGSIWPVALYAVLAGEIVVWGRDNNNRAFIQDS